MQLHQLIVLSLAVCISSKCFQLFSLEDASELGIVVRVVKYGERQAATQSLSGVKYLSTSCLVQTLQLHTNGFRGCCDCWWHVCLFDNIGKAGTVYYVFGLIVWSFVFCFLLAFAVFNGFIFPCCLFVFCSSMIFQNSWVCFLCWHSLVYIDEIYWNVMKFNSFSLGVTYPGGHGHEKRSKRHQRSGRPFGTIQRWGRRRGVPKSRSRWYWYAEDLGNNGNMPRLPRPRFYPQCRRSILDFCSPIFFLIVFCGGIGTLEAIHLSRCSGLRFGAKAIFLEHFYCKQRLP